jgi:hypothetical protein
LFYQEVNKSHNIEVGRWWFLKDGYSILKNTK